MSALEHGSVAADYRHAEKFAQGRRLSVRWQAGENIFDAGIASFAPILLKLVALPVNPGASAAGRLPQRGSDQVDADVPVTPASKVRREQARSAADVHQ